MSFTLTTTTSLDNEGEGTVSVSLSAAPDSNVQVVALILSPYYTHSSDSGEGYNYMRVPRQNDSDLSGMSRVLEFTTSDWSTAQTITTRSSSSSTTFKTWLLLTVIGRPAADKLVQLRQIV